MSDSFLKFSILLEEVIKKNNDLLKKLKIYKHLSEEELKKFEISIQNVLPISYKEFLKKYGELFIGGKGFLGSIDNPNITVSTRKRGNLPKEFTVVYELGDGEMFCINTKVKSTEDESPIVAYLPGSDMPVTECDHISDSFGDFILETVWNDLVEEGIDLSNYQHLKPKNKGWNYNG